jgi:outer membrane protein assembly factor BamB
VSAYDAITGREVWRVDAALRTRRNHEAWGGGLAYDNGRLFVSSGYRFVAALDAGSGKKIWETRTDAPVHAAPTVSGGRVFVESVDDDLLTFDEASGAMGWTYQALVEPARILEATSPAITSDEVVASFASGELVALQTTNGNGLWTAVLSKSNRNSALSEIRDIPGRPVVYKGDVYAVSHSGLFRDLHHHPLAGRRRGLRHRHRRRSDLCGAGERSGLLGRGSQQEGQEGEGPRQLVRPGAGVEPAGAGVLKGRGGGAGSEDGG